MRHDKRLNEMHFKQRRVIIIVDIIIIIDLFFVELIISFKKQRKANSGQLQL